MKKQQINNNSNLKLEPLQNKSTAFLTSNSKRHEGLFFVFLKPIRTTNMVLEIRLSNESSVNSNTAELQIVKKDGTFERKTTSIGADNTRYWNVEISGENITEIKFIGDNILEIKNLEIYFNNTNYM